MRYLLIGCLGLFLFFLYMIIIDIKHQNRIDEIFEQYNK